MKQKENLLLVLDEPLSSDNIFYGNRTLPQINGSKYHIADGDEKTKLLYIDPINKKIQKFLRFTGIEEQSTLSLL